MKVQDWNQVVADYIAIPVVATRQTDISVLRRLLNVTQELDAVTKEQWLTFFSNQKTANRSYVNSAILAFEYFYGWAKLQGYDTGSSLDILEENKEDLLAADKTNDLISRSFYPDLEEMLRELDHATLPMYGIQGSCAVGIAFFILLWSGIDTKTTLTIKKKDISYAESRQKCRIWVESENKYYDVIGERATSYLYRYHHSIEYISGRKSRYYGETEELLRVLKPMSYSGIKVVVNEINASARKQGMDKEFSMVWIPDNGRFVRLLNYCKKQYGHVPASLTNGTFRDVFMEEFDLNRLKHVPAMMALKSHYERFVKWVGRYYPDVDIL